jgi:DNA-binding GntR family transcriptional regulator
MGMSEPAGFEPINRESTAGIIARQLRAAIMYGSLPPGSQLGESELAERFQVSRGPLREAMQRLVQEGLLRSERNRGLFVITLDPEDVRDVYMARAAVERAAVSLILKRDYGQVAARLDTAHRKIVQAARRRDYHALSDADLSFHAAMIAESGSPRLARMHGTLLVESRMCMTALERTYVQPDDVAVEHGEFVKALIAGDEQRLFELIDAHAEDAVRRLARGEDKADARPAASRRSARRT